MSALTPHLAALERALDRFDHQATHVAEWGAELASVLRAGGRLLCCGDGGGAEQARRLTAELVGRDGPAFSAIPLSADAAAVTADGQGAGEMFARQVRAHGRPGDILIGVSTSGGSRDVIAAAVAASETGVRTWALTGPGPNPLTAVCDDAITVSAPLTSTVQEVQLAAVHMLCAAVEAAVALAEGSARLGDGAR